MNNENEQFKHGDLTEKIIGCYYAVYNELGFGFLETVYREAMAVALREIGLIIESKVRIPVFFRGNPISVFEADLIVERKVILEFKSVESLIPIHEAQLLNYLKATDIEVGLLFNFGLKPKFKRLAFENDRKQLRPQLDDFD